MDEKNEIYENKYNHIEKSKENINTNESKINQKETIYNIIL